MIEDFKQALTTGKVHHSWLLSGGRGTGKLGFALEAAALLLGEEVTIGSPYICYVSPEEGAANIGIEEMRAVKNFVHLASERARVVIINSLDEVSSEGEDTILKLLEEPPQGVQFFLLSNGLRTPKATIRSRSRLLRFRDASKAEALRKDLIPTDDKNATEKAAALAYFSGNNPPLAEDIVRADDSLDIVLAFYRAITALPHTEGGLITKAVNAAKKAEPILWECFFAALFKKLATDAQAIPTEGLKAWDEIHSLYRMSRWAYLDARSLMVAVFYNYKRLAKTN